jgi:hypothetical protein
VVFSAVDPNAMSGWVIVVLAWVGFSPILGLVLGRFLGRADDLAQRAGDPALNLRRPDALPAFVATQLVPSKPAGPYSLSRTP